jgi:hypothetical protein
MEYMHTRTMFSPYSCAGVVSGGVACFFLGMVLLFCSIMDMISSNGGLNFQYISLSLALGFIIWIFGWYLFYFTWKNEQIRRRTAFRLAISIALCGAGMGFCSLLELLIF